MTASVALPTNPICDHASLSCRSLCTIWHDQSIPISSPWPPFRRLELVDFGIIFGGSICILLYEPKMGDSRHFTRRTAHQLALPPFTRWNRSAPRRGWGGGGDGKTGLFLCVCIVPF